MQANEPVVLRAAGWRRGLRSLWRKEMGEWWQTRTWLIHVLIWIVLINGLLAVVSYAVPLDPSETTPLAVAQIDLLISMGSSATAIGVIIAMQNALIGERQSGTAAWIMSKPASRTSFILAKLGANAVSFLPLAVLLPMAIAFGEVRIFGTAFAPLPYLGMVGILALHTLFFLTLTLMLGSLFSKRGAVLGTAIGTLFLSSLVGGLGPIAQFTPFGLTNASTRLMADGSLPVAQLMPVIATILCSALFAVIAVWRFQSEEL